MISRIKNYSTAEIIRKIKNLPDDFETAKNLSTIWNKFTLAMSVLFDEGDPDLIIRKEDQTFLIPPKLTHNHYVQKAYSKTIKLISDDLIAELTFAQKIASGAYKSRVRLYIVSRLQELYPTL